MAMTRDAALRVGGAPLFVLIWSTGFVVARAVRGEVDPNLFLASRFGLTMLIFAGVAWALGVPWPRGRAIGQHFLAGVLINGLYLGPSYWAVAHGLPASVMALLGAVQPLMVALAAWGLLGERVGRATWAGLLIGLAGVGLVMAPRMAAGDAGYGSPMVLAAAAVAILSMTAGALMQKTSLAAADLRSASAIQNLGGAVTCAVLALALGEDHWQGDARAWAALGWAAVVLSGMGTTLLLWMLRTGSAARATALLLVVPPLVALETFFLFGDALSPVQIAGFAVAIAGVWLARR